MKKVCTLFLFSLCLQHLYAQQNVILIIADDLGVDYCGFYEHGTDTAKMPNIRSLLNKGVKFNNAWASAYCSSTRAGILTGRYPFRTGVGTVIGGTSSVDLDSSEIAIAELLKYTAPVKYATANIGKWHINKQTPQKVLYPTTVYGYDIYQGNFLGALNSYTNWNKITNGVDTTVITNYATTETVNDAINWMDTLSSGKPFFIWLAFNAPHSPYHLPPAALHTVPGLTGTAMHINQNPDKYFMAMTEAMDTEIGRLFQYLNTNNLMDSTNIIFIGDNGDDNRVAQIGDSAHTKGTLYQYGIKVPFIISGPAVVNPNRSSDSIINTPDLFATVLELAGFNNWSSAIPTGKIIDSKSLLPIIKNQNTIVHNWVFTELFTTVPTIKDGKTIRNLNYKLIRFDDGHQEFYKIISDSLEQNNLVLQTSLPNDDISNYYYLCNEMSNLVGNSACFGSIGIEDIFPENDMMFYPNPINQSLNLLLNIESEIAIIDLLGNICYQKKMQQGQHTIDMNHYPKGMYILRSKNDIRTVSKRIAVGY